MSDAEDPGFSPDDIEDIEDPEPRRGRGFLTSDVNRILKMYVSGEFEIEEGKFLTPFIVGRLLKEIDSLEAAPSSGAITAIFNKWKDSGYATFRRNPFAFVDFTDEGRELGLEGFAAKKRADRKAVLKQKAGQS